MRAELAELERWTIHDLRRTSRTLMSRAGVSADIAEQCLGHAIPGVRGIYDRHRFEDEKRAASRRMPRDRADRLSATERGRPRSVEVTG